ncbi:MAG: aspartyl protease family protein [Anaerolineales bacterium]
MKVKRIAELELIIVPDEAEPGAAAVMVDGSIGSQPYRFLLDTGAATTTVVFDDHTAKLPVTGRKSSSGVFGQSADDLITVPHLTAGPISKRDFQIARLAQGAEARDNLLGMDCLKDAGWHFDFGRGKGGRIELLEGMQDDSWEELYMDAKSHPYVEVGLDGTTLDAVWDTGAGVTVVDESLVAQHPTCFHPSGTSSGTDSSGATVETEMWMVEGLTIGGKMFRQHKVATVDLSHVNVGLELPMSLILGFTTLILSPWSMDFPGRRWRLGRLNENHSLTPSSGR